MRRDAGTTTHGTRGVLVFPIGEILFGAPVEEVLGLIEASHVTPLPRQSGPAAGVLAFRGSMIPAFDLDAYLGVAPIHPGAPRYGLVLARGSERFALLIPALPRLVRGKELKEAEIGIADSELGALVGSVYTCGSDRVHCLQYWSIYDAVMPPAATPRRGGAIASP